MLFEDEKVYMFKDIAPKADVHLLIIPKLHIRDTNQLITVNDFNLVEHMIKVAKRYVKDHYKQYKLAEDLELHFHKPLFTMVKHLHMHVTVGGLTLKGRIFFCSCMSQDPRRYTRKEFMGI